MCFERHLRHRREQGEESSELWQDFERTRPVAGPEPPAEVIDPDPAEAREEVTSSER